MFKSLNVLSLNVAVVCNFCQIKQILKKFCLARFRFLRLAKITHFQKVISSFAIWFCKSFCKFDLRFCEFDLEFCPFMKSTICAGVHLQHYLYLRLTSNKCKSALINRFEATNCSFVHPRMCSLIQLKNNELFP